MPDSTGWSVIVDHREGDHPTYGYVYQPCLQLGGWVTSLDVWFDSPEKCQRFIEEDVVGKGLADARGD